jgi:Ser/Thr protein kinase RdoA (MazF antagonist)
MDSADSAARAALSAWGEGFEPSAMAGGLINRSFAVRGPNDARYVLQRVSPIFDPSIHDNVLAVTEHIASRGLTTPLLVATTGGSPWASTADGGVWRLLTRVPGVSFHEVQGPAQARAAGALVARFHSALEDLDHEFVARRLGVHDTPAHLATLATAVDAGRSHRLHDAVAPLAEAILPGAEALAPLGEVPERAAHGDLKISNVLFAGPEPPGSEEPVCLVDLDTLGPMPLCWELGDAWRSWCNPLGEDVEETRFDLPIYEAAVAGYAAGCTLELLPEERASLIHGLEWVTLELAARFAADALRETYFGWDEARFSGLGEHNLVRARGQWCLHQAVMACRSQRAAALAAL